MARPCRQGVHDKIPGSVGPAVEIGKQARRADRRTRCKLVAKDAFVSGMHLAVVVAAVIILVAAIAVYLWLPARAPEAVDEGVETIIDLDDPDATMSPEPVS